MSDDLSGDMLAPSWPNLVYHCFVSAAYGLVLVFISVPISLTIVSIINAPSLVMPLQPQHFNNNFY